MDVEDLSFIVLLINSIPFILFLILTILCFLVEKRALLISVIGIIIIAVISIPILGINLLAIGMNEAMEAKYYNDAESYSDFYTSFFMGKDKNLYLDIPHKIHGEFYLMYQPPFMQGGETFQLILMDVPNGVEDLQTKYEFKELSTIENNHTYPNFLYYPEDETQPFPEISKCTSIIAPKSEEWNHGESYSICIMGNDILYYIQNW